MIGRDCWSYSTNWDRPGTGTLAGPFWTSDARVCADHSAVCCSGSCGSSVSRVVRAAFADFEHFENEMFKNSMVYLKSH